MRKMPGLGLVVVLAARCGLAAACRADGDLVRAATRLNLPRPAVSWRGVRRVTGQSPGSLALPDRFSATWPLSKVPGFLVVVQRGLPDDPAALAAFTAAAAKYQIGRASCRESGVDLGGR